MLPRNRNRNAGTFAKITLLRNRPFGSSRKMVCSDVEESMLRCRSVSGIASGKIPWERSQHVLIVLVFWSWVLLLPRLPPSSRSLKLFPWASILLHGPLDICMDLLPAAPLPPMQKQDAQHMFLQHRGAHADFIWSAPKRT